MLKPVFRYISVDERIGDYRWKEADKEQTQRNSHRDESDYEPHISANELAHIATISRLLAFSCSQFASRLASTSHKIDPSHVGG
jgi:hypothetical protein